MGGQLATGSGRWRLPETAGDRCKSAAVISAVPAWVPQSEPLLGVGEHSFLLHKISRIRSPTTLRFPPLHLLRQVSGKMNASSSSRAIEIDIGPRVLKKIDRAIIPLLFVTYMLNFMDKIILSSAAVFGLRDDTASSAVRLIIYICF